MHLKERERERGGEREKKKRERERDPFNALLGASLTQHVIKNADANHV